MLLFQALLLILSLTQALSEEAKILFQDLTSTFAGWTDKDGQQMGHSQCNGDILLGGYQQWTGKKSISKEIDLGGEYEAVSIQMEVKVIDDWEEGSSLIVFVDGHARRTIKNTKRGHLTKSNCGGMWGDDIKYEDIVIEFEKPTQKFTLKFESFLNAQLSEYVGLRNLKIYEGILYPGETTPSTKSLRKHGSQSESLDVYFIGLIVLLVPVTMLVGFKLTQMAMKKQKKESTSDANEQDELRESDFKPKLVDNTSRVLDSHRKGKSDLSMEPSHVHTFRHDNAGAGMVDLSNTFSRPLESSRVPMTDGRGGAIDLRDYPIRKISDDSINDVNSTPDRFDKFREKYEAHRQKSQFSGFSPAMTTGHNLISPSESNFTLSNLAVHTNNQGTDSPRLQCDTLELPPVNETPSKNRLMTNRTVSDY